MSQEYNIQVTNDDAHRRLDEFLASRFGSLSRMRLANLIASGAVLVNSSPSRPGYLLEPQDLICIRLQPGPPTAMTPEKRDLEIIFEDDHLVVAVKPPDVLVHPTKGVKSGTLLNALVYHVNRVFYEKTDSDKITLPLNGEAHSIVRPGIVHRLDRATSGLMVIAKNQRALRILSSHFHRRLVEKRYTALVSGGLKESEGRVIAPIKRVEDRDPRWWVDEEGKPAETRFTVIKQNNQYSLVELEPVTGRTNQLRIHCAFIGHPIVGDRIYTKAGLRTEIPETDYNGSRLHLHAHHLGFHHPCGGQWMVFRSEHGFRIPE